MKTLILAAPLLMLAIAAPIPAYASEAPAVAPGDTLLTLTAGGKSTATPDLATYSAGVQTNAKTAGAAMAANAEAMAQVIAALKSAGIADRDIQTSNLSLSPQYAPQRQLPDGSYSRQTLTGYQANNTLTIRERHLADIGRLLDTLVMAGANEVSGPNFGLDHPEAAQDQARLAAMAAARARADLYARAAGLHVTRILSIAESGGYAPQPMMMPRVMMAAAKAATQVEAGELSLDASVTVQFELAP